MSIPVKVRTARKLHFCDTHGIHHIRPGDRYEVWTEEPKGEVFNADRWSRLKTCGEAAARYGQDSIGWSLTFDVDQEATR